VRQWCPTRLATSPAHDGQNRVDVPKRRSTNAQVPEALVRYRENDWVGPNNPLEYPDPMPGRPHICWSNARRRWAREHVRTAEDLDRL
jgi:hypothetical protein